MRKFIYLCREESFSEQLTKQKINIMNLNLTKCFVASVAVLCGTTSAIAQSNLLHYNRPAQYFEEALPIGNGNLGAMIYGGVDEDKLSLNDITLWTGEPDTKVYAPEAYKTIPLIREALDKGDYRRADELQRKVQGHYSESYQPLGCLRIASSQKETAKDYLRTLDISNAHAKVVYKSDKGSVTRD